jgi:adenylyltransferase/sulfurtransferase
MDKALDRYSRQARFPGVGEDGQRRLLASNVTLCGVGALGTVIANALVRGGIGRLRLVDRDFVETNNLQRQVLFDEGDVRDNLPKAEAAARKLREINSTVQIEPVVADVDHTNIVELIQDADVVLDGTDNFEVRYLINDAAVKLEKPWVYGGCIGSHGQSMTIVPGMTPCLRCVFEAAPAPGETGTCETAGVLAPIVNVIASLQVAEAVKLLLGRLELINRDLVFIDVWENVFRRFQISALRDRVDCVCCRQKRFDWLDGKQGSQTTRLCGRNAVQISPRTRGRIDLDQMFRHLGPDAHPTLNRFLLKFEIEGCQCTLFPDGRAIIQGTDDPEKARGLYAKYVGH